MRQSSRVVLLALGLTLLGTPVTGQTGAIEGQIRDGATGQPVPDVEVQAITRGRVAAGTISRPDGSFRLSPLPAGTYVVATEKLGYAERRATIDLAAGATVRTDF